MTRLIKIVVAILLSGAVTTMPASAQQRLGGVDLQNYCQTKFGTGVRKTGSTVNDWRCGHSSLSVNDACRMTYGQGARAAYGSFSDSNSWYCYR